MASFWEFQESLKKKPEPAASEARPVMTVSELTTRIDKAIKMGVPATVLVKGEVSNFKAYGSSGHLYFTLKDASACVDCVMFKDSAARLRFSPGDGLELLATGRVGVYGQRGKYQLYVSSLEPLGKGALELARQQIQEKLEKAGLFDPSRKKDLPKYPRRIVMVTSTQTAAMQDMLKVLRRFAHLKISVFHTPVQGDGSAEKIADALRFLSRQREALGGVDLILLSRGGGSLEDLWEFNEEILAHAIAASEIPIVTGIGHEIDVSIADLVADYHAHTPTEAAQVVTQHWRSAPELLGTFALRLTREVRAHVRQCRTTLESLERHEAFRRPMDHVNSLRQMLDDKQRDMTIAVADRLAQCTAKLSRLHGRLRERHPRHLVQLTTVRLTAFAARLTRAMNLTTRSQLKQIDALAARLNAVSPQQVLKRGYSLTTLKKTGAIVRNAAQLRQGDKLVTRLSEGEVVSTVDDPKQPGLFE